MAVFKPANSGSWVNCSSNMHNFNWLTWRNIFFSPLFPSGASNGWIWTHELRIMSQLFYHFCSCHQQTLRNLFFIFSTPSQCQQWLDSNPQTQDHESIVLPLAQLQQNKHKKIFFSFHYFLSVPAVAGFEPMNSGSRVICSTDCANCRKPTQNFSSDSSNSMASQLTQDSLWHEI